MNVEGIRETRNAVKRSAHLNDNWKVIINRLCDELEASQRVELSDEDELLIRTKIHTVAEGVIYPEVAVSDIIKTLRDKQPSEQVDLNELISELCYSGKLDNRTTADEAREILERHLKTKEG